MSVKIRKKMKLNTKVKIGLIIMLSCSIIALSIGIYQEANQHKIKKEEKTAYQYTLQPKLVYSVHIKNNPVYDGTLQQEGLKYSKKLLDYIEVSFENEFQGSEEAETEFIYKITAEIQGYENLKGESPVILWSKPFDLTDEIKKQTTESTFKEDRQVRFDLMKYDDFALQARDITGMEVSAQVVIRLTGNLKIQTQKGILTSPVETDMTIPLLEDIFNITKKETAPITGNITEPIEIPIPVNDKIILLFSLLIVFCIIGLLIILIGTESPNAYDILKGKARKLLKNYGSRMIVIQSKTEQNYLQIYELHSIDDLIKVSDEIQKPVFYLKDDIDIIKDYAFHVTDGNNLYVYRVI